MPGCVQCHKEAGEEDREEDESSQAGVERINDGLTDSRVEGGDDVQISCAGDGVDTSRFLFCQSQHQRNVAGNRQQRIGPIDRL